MFPIRHNWLYPSITSENKSSEYKENLKQANASAISNVPAGVERKRLIKTLNVYHVKIIWKTAN